MQLYLESSIIQARDNDEGDDPEMMVSIGSGILGQSLFLPLSQFLKVAAKTGGVRVGSFLSLQTAATVSASNDADAHRLRKQRKQERNNQFQSTFERVFEGAFDACSKADLSRFRLKQFL